MLKIKQIPVLNDNYIYLGDFATTFACIDPALSEPGKKLITKS